MDCKTANRMMVPFLEGALSLEETDHFLKHIKECSGCREDLEIYYTVRTAIDGMDQDRFKTYNLKQQFEHDMSQVARQVRAGLFIQWLHHIALTAATVAAAAVSTCVCCIIGGFRSKILGGNMGRLFAVNRRLEPVSTQYFGNLPREILYAKKQEEKEAWYHKIMMTSKGVYTNGIFGFLRYLFKIIKEQKPAYLAVAWDLTRDTFRRELYADYKGNRSETPEPLREQFALCQEVLANMESAAYIYFEADDLWFYGATNQSQLPVKILTKDNDYLQLVTDNTTLWLMHSSAEKTQEIFDKYHMKKEDMAIPDRVFPFNPQLVKEEFGIEPCHVNSLKGLAGDKSDNITGVPGVGAVSAVKLIKEYGTVESYMRQLIIWTRPARRRLRNIGRKSLICVFTACLLIKGK
ncbi:MAG: 5'-3' exonuclease H3TH domain-containing protein [Lachnospiraceae bacterium]